MRNFLAFAVDVAAEVSLAHVRFVNVRHDMLKVFVEPAPDDFFIDKQKIRLGKETFAAIIFFDRRREIFMPVVERVDVIGVQCLKNFLASVTACAVRQNAKRGVNAIGRVENIFVAVKRGEVLPTEGVDTC